MLPVRPIATIPIAIAKGQLIPVIADKTAMAPFLIAVQSGLEIAIKFAEAGLKPEAVLARLERKLAPATPSLVRPDTGK